MCNWQQQKNTALKFDEQPIAGRVLTKECPHFSKPVCPSKPAACLKAQN
jgi:hypothetical protein